MSTEIELKLQLALAGFCWVRDPNLNTLTERRLQ